MNFQASPLTLCPVCLDFEAEWEHDFDIDRCTNCGHGIQE